MTDNVSQIKPAHVGHFQFYVRHGPWPAYLKNTAICISSGTGTFYVNHKFHPTHIGWNRGLTRKIILPPPLYIFHHQGTSAPLLDWWCIGKHQTFPTFLRMAETSDVHHLIISAPAAHQSPGACRSSVMNNSPWLGVHLMFSEVQEKVYNILGVGNSRVHPRLHPTGVGWNLGWTRKCPSPTYWSRVAAAVFCRGACVIDKHLLPTTAIVR